MSDGSLGVPDLWSADAPWFEARVGLYASRGTSGCCPVAIAMYTRYATSGHRCCSSRLAALHRLRPRHSRLLPVLNASVVVVGDSLAEQLYISALCLGWLHRVDLKLRMERSGGCETCVGTTWVAELPAWGSVFRYIRASVGLPHSRHLAEASVVLHGFGPNNDGHKQNKPRPQHIVNSVLERYDEVRKHRRPARVVFAEEMAQHWPGGVYVGQGADAYPPSENVCVQHAQPNGSNAYPFELNRALHEAIASRTGQGFAVLPLEALTRSRGDAHIGPLLPTPPAGVEGRDCLHWCIAPGITDALGYAVLSILAQVAAERPA